MPPLYDWECYTCSHVWEDFPTKHGAPLCPSCTSTEVRKKFPVPVVTSNKSDFDLLNKRPPDPKVFSGPYHRSK